MVKDTLPSYLTFSGAIIVRNPAGVDVSTDWACTKGSQVFPGETIARITLVCTKLTALPANSGLYTFTVPVVLSTIAPVAVNMQNVVYVCANNMVGNPTGPNGEVICGNNNPPPPPPPAQCTPTNNPQKDPACIVVPPPVCTVNCGGGGGSSNIGKKCVNGIATCASYNSITACIADGIPAALCYPADAVGQTMCATQSLSCSGPGGGGGGGGSSSGLCGDGVLGSSAGEECDVVGAPWCVSCKVKLNTTPGANPITDLWMTIPLLAGTQRLGYTWLDGIPGKVAFSDNRMVLGVGTKAFTLADTVGFGIRTQYRIPLMIEANKKICIKSEGTSLNSENICTTFGEGAPTSMLWTRPIDGKKYVVIGQGDFQYQNILAGPYYVNSVNNSNDITLFK